LTGEGIIDIVKLIKASKSSPEIRKEKSTLKHSIPSAVYGQCCGNEVISEKAVQQGYLTGEII
jgi:hypothetical protein